MPARLLFKENKQMTQAPLAAKPADSSNKNPFRVLKNREYALYFSGQLISQVGTWMQQIAISWLTYKLTNSAFLLSVVSVSGMLPSLLLTPFAGVVADRFNRHKIVVFTQVAAMLEASVLAYLTMTHQIQIWQLISLGIVRGVVAAFDMPVRSAFVMDMVKSREDLPATIALNSSLMNVSRLFGPALAGFMVASVGEGMCFAVNAASYIAVIAALMFVKGKFEPKKDGRGSVLSEFVDGLKYVMNSSPIRAPILLLAMFGFGGMAFAQLLPVFVKEIGGDANTLGYLSSASAFGSIIGTIVLATRKGVLGLGKWIIAASFAYAFALIGFSFVHTVWIAIPVLALVGAAMMLQMGSCNTVIQAVVDNDKRGRVMSLFTLAFMGTMPLGSLAAGWLTTHVGFNTMVLICGIYCLCVAVVFTTQMPRLRRESKPIYIERGLLETEEELEILTKPLA
jgi:MFS family permease